MTATRVDVEIEPWAPTSVVTARAGDLTQHRQPWVRLGQALHTGGVPARSMTLDTLSAAVWGDLVHRSPGGSDPAGDAGFALAVEAVRLGIAAEDLYVIASAMARPGTDTSRSPNRVARSPNRVARSLAGWARHMHEDCSLRDFLGWLLFKGDAQEWIEIGLGFEAWLYAAAGLTPAETLAWIEDGTRDEQALVMMAGLRGVSLPVR